MTTTHWVPAWDAEPFGIDRSTGRAAFLESPRIGVEPFETNKVVLIIEGKRVIVDPWKLHSAMDDAIKIARGKQI
jgi:hypothetical protein